MNIVQITPGAGAMYCGNCLRDNALVAELRQMGHSVLMVPLYLPLTLDEEDQSAGTPIFFSGINVYLGQKSVFFRKAPEWLHQLLASRPLLEWAGTKAGKTRAQGLGELTASMLRGEEGRQARELEELIAWLKTHVKPDVICLSNVLLIGMARRLRSEVGAPVICMLQGEDWFLDALPEPHRTECWKTVGERAREADMLVACSEYFGKLMRERLALPAEKIRVVHNGISLKGYESPAPKSEAPRATPVLGYFARMCREKGLDTLVEAYLLLRQRGQVKDLKLRVGGSCGPSDEPLVAALRDKLRRAGVLDQAEFCPNLDRAAKLDFLRSLSVFSVPARYGEAFGLYVIEAMAAGVPVVQPRTASFPELVEITGGGVLTAPEPQALADAIEALLLNPDHAQDLGLKGHRAVAEKFSAAAMARSMFSVFSQVSVKRGFPAPAKICG